MNLYCYGKGYIRHWELSLVLIIFALLKEINETRKNNELVSIFHSLQ